MTNTRRTLRLPAAVAVLAVAGLTAGCKSEQASPKPLTAVRVSEVRTLEGGGTTPYSATISPYAQANISFKSGGYIDSILMVKGADDRRREVWQGDWVEKDAVLATIRQSDYLNQLKQAQGQLAQTQVQLDHAKLDWARAESLYASASMTKSDYDAEKAKLDLSTAQQATAEAALAEARQQLADCEVKAPISGWLVARNVEIGSLVGPSVIGFTIADAHLVKVVFGVPDTALGTVRLGEEQTITTEAVPEEFRGRITAISSSADPKSRVFSVEVTVPNPRSLLKQNMIATLTLGAPKMPKPITAVPLSAVVRSIQNPEGFAVFVIEERDGKSVVRSRDVHIGDTYGNMIAVSEGVNLGEHVISTGATLVKEGEQVQVIP